MLYQRAYSLDLLDIALVNSSELAIAIKAKQTSFLILCQLTWLCVHNQHVWFLVSGANITFSSSLLLITISDDANAVTSSSTLLLLSTLEKTRTTASLLCGQIMNSLLIVLLFVGKNVYAPIYQA